MTTPTELEAAVERVTNIEALQARVNLAMFGDPNDVEPWACIGCGLPAPRKIRPCDCPSGLVFLRDDLRRHSECKVNVGPDVAVPMTAGELSGLLSALAEANERASLLRDTVRTRCAERDEARRLLLSAFVAGAEYMAASSGSPSDPATVAAGGRWMSDNRTALNPQQEGSRDHGK